jgi:hypothetical protein
MSEQTANLCTTDACESLRARLAKYEDAEGRPIVDAQRLLDWNRLQPEPRPIVVGREYQVAEACARLNSSPVIAGEFGDAYQGAREDLAIWKRRALEAESKIHDQDRIIENLGNALNDENGPTFMGEPVVSAGGVDERAAFEAQLNPHCRKRNEHGDYVVPEIQDRWDGWQARAALSAPSHGEQVREGWKLVPVEPTEAMLREALSYDSIQDPNNPDSRVEELLIDWSLMLAGAPSAVSQE